MSRQIARGHRQRRAELRARRKRSRPLQRPLVARLLPAPQVVDNGKGGLRNKHPTEGGYTYLGRRWYLIDPLSSNLADVKPPGGAKTRKAALKA